MSKQTELLLRLENGKHLRRMYVEPLETKESVIDKLTMIGFEVVKDDWPEELTLRIKR